jgi:uncharacterized membrane protein
MWFWWFMLICDMIIPVVMIIVGRMMWKHCPKSINGIVGYRTNRSMKNMDTWKFANEHCGRLWYKMGLFMLAFSVLVSVLLLRTNDNTYSMISLIFVLLQCIILIVSIIPTELALKKMFYEDGTRK